MIWKLVGLHGINEYATRKIKKVWNHKPCPTEIILEYFEREEAEELVAGKTIKKSFSKYYLEKGN